MSDIAVHPSLPIGGIGHRGVGWWGVLCLIATEGALFCYLLFSYFYCAVQFPASWLPDPRPSVALSLPNTFVLLFSSVAVWWGERGVRRGSRAQGVLGLALAFILGVAFLVVQGFEWRSKKFSLASNLYSSLFFTVTGFHMAHVIVGVLALAALVAWTALGYFDGRRNVPVLITTAYWHFVDIVWLFVFATFYVSPYVWY